MAITLAAASSVGCSKEVEGPAPSIEPPSQSAQPPPVDPGIVCAAQLDTDVTVNGMNFSPIPIDIPDDPKAALPDITLTRSHELDGATVSAPDEVLYSGNPDRDETNAYDEDGEPLLRWTSKEEMHFRVVPELTLSVDEAGEPAERGQLPDGVWDVTVRNSNGDMTESLQSLAVVDKPTLQPTSPGIVCLDQGPRTIELTGTTFLRNGSDTVVMQVEGVDSPFEVELMECTDIANDGIDASTCTKATVDLAEGSIDVGFPALNMLNPETAACTSEDDIKLRVVPEPTVDRVVPPLGCVTEESRTFTIEGMDFLIIDGSDPVVTVGDNDYAPDSLGGCEALETQEGTEEVEKCSSVTFTVAKEGDDGSLEPGLYDVTVTNPDPAGCGITLAKALRIVPPPALVEIIPPLVCLDDGAREIVVEGSDYLTVDGELPAVEVDGMTIKPKAVKASGCKGLETDQLDVERCDTLTVTLDQGQIGIGQPDVTVTNPAPAGCSDSRSDLLTIVEGPTITSATPALTCSYDGTREITIGGTGFLDVDGELPAVTIDGTAVASVDAIGGCADVTVNKLDVRQCDELVVTVAEDALAEGNPTIEVTNPDPAGCMASDSMVLTVPPELTITMIEPVNVCQDTVDAAFAVTLTGTGFLSVDGAVPSVDFNTGTAVIPTLDIGNNSVCTELTVDGTDDVFSCDEMQITLDLMAADTAAPAMLPIIVTTDNAPGCTLSRMTALNVVPPPTVDETCNHAMMMGPGTGSDPCVDISGTDVEDEVCSDISFTVTITGTDFVDGATVKFVQDSSMMDSEEVVADTVTVISDTQIEATFSDGLPHDMSDPTWDLIVENAGACSSPAVIDVILVNPTPLVFFVDPPVVYNQITIETTVFTSGLGGASVLDTIELVDDSMNATELSATVSMAKPNRILAVVPDENPDTMAPFTPGDYEVRVTSALGCTGSLPGGLTITGDPQMITGLAIDPAYASSTEPTAVTITADASPGVGSSPRVYLSPSGGGTATALRAVVVENSGQLTAVIPSGLTPDTYSLIVVDPSGDGGNGTVGVITDGVLVTADEPPTVTDVAPQSVTFNDASLAMTVTGMNFDMTNGVDVVIDCINDMGNPEMITLNGAPTVDSVNQITLDVNTNGTTDGSICTLTVINMRDGASYTFSAIAVRNNDNLNPWSAGTAMNEGRRALALVAARPTQTSRFLYAIGGDDGTLANAKTSVESVSVDVFGDLGPQWNAQANSLPDARTQAGFARIDNFIYLTGGYDGSSAVNSVLRAQVLDPLAGPEIDEVDAALGDPDAGTGLPGALWQYQVAYTYPSTDPSNPGGESIAGEILNVNLPDRPEGIILALTWDENADADGYKLYRTISDSMSGIELLATCPGDTGCTCNGSVCTYTDNGTVSTMGGEIPLPPGSLGVWHQPYIDNMMGSGVAVMGSAREGHATVAVKHPNTTDHADDWVLYSFGGRDDNPTVLNDYEYAIVTVNGDGSQSMSAWQGGTRDLGVDAKADLAAWAVTPEDTTDIPAGSVYIFVGTGFTDLALNNTTAEVRSGSLNSATMGGDLVAADAMGHLDSENASGIARGAACFGNASAFLNLFGGENGAGNLQGDKAGNIVAGPDTTNSWSAPGGGTLVMARSYCATAQESAFYFTAGGRTAAAAASTSVERTIQ